MAPSRTVASGTTGLSRRGQERRGSRRAEGYCGITAGDCVQRQNIEDLFWLKPERIVGKLVMVSITSSKSCLKCVL